ncbi:MAG: hypothetical protein WDN26_24250 [Chitinophagaceae bacterium]
MGLPCYRNIQWQYLYRKRCRKLFDYAFEIGWGAKISILNNSISNNIGIATVDNSGSSAISVWDDAGTEATIAGNTMTNNSIGVAVVDFTGGSIDPKVIFGAGNLFDGGDYGIDFQVYGPASSPNITFTDVFYI